MFWRRGRDSNPRSPVRGTTVFETAPFDRSGTSPRAIQEGPEPSRWHVRLQPVWGSPARLRDVSILATETGSETMPAIGAKRVGVIGAGMVGVCAASWLQRDGHSVFLVDAA